MTKSSPARAKRRTSKKTGAPKRRTSKKTNEAPKKPRPAASAAGKRMSLTASEVKSLKAMDSAIGNKKQALANAIISISRNEKERKRLLLLIEQDGEKHTALTREIAESHGIDPDDDPGWVLELKTYELVHTGAIA